MLWCSHTISVQELDLARKQEAGTAAVNAVAEAGPRRGTATRKAGQRTAAIIVDAALDVIGGEARVAFSLRAVAEQAGVSLANLQYYYPSRDDLLRAMFAEFGRRYSAACEAALSECGGAMETASSRAACEGQSRTARDLWLPSSSHRTDEAV